jgi:hypothetical protein
VGEKARSAPRRPRSREPGHCQGLILNFLLFFLFLETIESDLDFAQSVRRKRINFAREHQTRPAMSRSRRKRKFEALPKSDGIRRLVWESLQTQFNTIYQADRRSFKVLQEMVAAGCDPNIVLLDLYLYCGDDQELRTARRRAEAFPGRLSQVAELMKQTATQYEAVMHELPNYGINKFGKRDQIEQLPGGKTLVHRPLSKELRDEAELLEQLSNAIEQSNKSGGGRNKHLVHLHYYLEEKMGKGGASPTRLSHLIEAMRGAYPKSTAPKASPETVRRMIKNFEKNRPTHAVSLRIDAELDAHPVENSQGNAEC